MKSILVFLALVAFAKAGVSMPRSSAVRIINGEDARLGEFPFQVSLQDLSSNHFCGGSILNKDYVITAAHCVDGDEPGDVKILAGLIDLDNPKETYHAERIIIHEEYDPSNSWVHDIALIKVSTPFEVSETIGYVPLPAAHEKVSANSLAVLSGWGDIGTNGEHAKILQRTDNVIADDDFCVKTLANAGTKVYESQICAWDPKFASGACHADSGGPLTVDGKLTGLVSFAFGCASTVIPTVFTRVSEHIDWIETHAV